MSKINDGGPDFGSGDPFHGGFAGMSLRDYFAAHTIGMGFDWAHLHETGGYAEAAAIAYDIADAMIAARDGGEK